MRVSVGLYAAFGSHDAQKHGHAAMVAQRELCAGSHRHAHRRDRRWCADLHQREGQGCGGASGARSGGMIFVIASEAKQSRAIYATLDCFAPLALTAIISIGLSGLPLADRKRQVQGKSVTVSVDLGV